MISVVCLKWGDLYGPEYVTRLRDGVARNLSVEHEFVCITDSLSGLPNDLEKILLPVGLDTWWGKVWLFSDECQGLLKGDKVLFLDLDTIILDDIDFLTRERVRWTPLTILRGFGYGHRFGSAVMNWPRGQYTDIWKHYADDPDKAQWLCAQFGDGAWIQLQVGEGNAEFWQDLWPGKLCSLKFHCSPETGPPERAAVVCFHGSPRPHEVDEGWRHDAWRGIWPKAA